MCAGNVGVGIKRSASGESGAGNAKKQKTALATYQQAQEHIRAQQARQVHLIFNACLFISSDTMLSAAQQGLAQLFGVHSM